MKKHKVISNWVKPYSKVLILGCGNGELLKFLQENNNVEAHGLDIDSEKVSEAISTGLSVIQGDINTDLIDYPDKSFDYIVAHDILQIMEKPDNVLKQIIRIADKSIISFPNFAYFLIRLSILFSGRMPKTKLLPYEWYDSPNIHLFTVKDFINFCSKQNFKIIDKFFTGLGRRKIPTYLLPNFFAEFAYFLISA